MKHLGTKYLETERLELRRFILEEWIKSYSKPDYYQWAIILKENGDNPVGCIGVNTIDERTEMAHIGYCLGRKWWHKGIMSEALKRVIEFLFEEVDVIRIESRFDPNNPYSGAVMVKCGMKYEGTLRMADRNNQGICDASYYAILRNEYNK